uniref:F-box domain-containing protein n=1 Tax=Caenorhabditis tropicalis TaxID=1561998 RepID=A0A1I7UQS4_9PELO
MKLLPLPFLAREQIFKEMEISELLLLSFISKRSRNAIFDMRFHFKNSMETFLKLGNEDGTDSLAYGIFYVGELGTHAIKWRFKEDSEDVKWEKVRINGNSFECSFEFPDEIPKMWIKDSIRMDFPFIIHSHFCNLFQLSTDIRVSADLNTLEEFPNIRSVHSLFVKGQYGCMAKLNNILNSLEISDELTITPYCEGKLSDDVQISKMKRISLAQGAFFHREHFLNFEGQNITLIYFGRVGDIISEDIRTFIREWIEGEKFVRVESISISGFGIPENEVLTTGGLMEGIESKRFDPERRPSVLEYTDSMKRHFPEDRTEFRDALDIERKTDGRLATVECSSGSFYFFVWPEETIRNFRQNS